MTSTQTPPIDTGNANSNLPVPRRGAGGTPGGIGTFFFGLALAVAGGYLISSRVMVSGAWGFGWFGGGGGFGIVMLPFLIGVGVLFFNGKSWIGWALMFAGLVIIVAEILMNLHIWFTPTPLYITLVMFGMLAAGLGLIIRSLRPM